MKSDLLRSGDTVLHYDIAQEKASALGRLGRRLESALSALAACPRTPDANWELRDSLVQQAGYALRLFVVQREACGLNDSSRIMRAYGVPKEVYARMGPLPSQRTDPLRNARGLVAAAEYRE